MESLKREKKLEDIAQSIGLLEIRGVKTGEKKDSLGFVWTE